MERRNPFINKIDELGIDYRLIQHEPVLTIADVERVLSVPRSLLVKTLIFQEKQRKGFVVAALPGDHWLNWGEFAKAARIKRGNIDFLKPEEIKEVTGFTLGGVPPFGFEGRFYLDKSLLKKDIVYAGGGSQRTLIKTTIKEILKANESEIVDILKQL